MALPAKINQRRKQLISDLHSYKTDSIGVDAAAWAKAVELGAQGMLCFCKDERKFFYAPASLVSECRVVDLGEYPQCRIPLVRAQSVKAARGINFGWTNVTVEAICKKEAPVRLAPEPSLFDLMEVAA